MKAKVLFAIMMSLTMAFNGVSVFAANTTENTTSSETITEVKDPTLTYGKVVSVNENSILAKDVKDIETIYNLDEKTIFINSGTGEKVSVDSIKEGDGVYFYHSPAMEDSYPGQTYVYAVAVNTPMDTSCIKYHVVDTITENNGEISITTDESDLVLKCKEDVEITFFGTNKKGSIEDLKLGTRFFTWYQQGTDMNGKPVENEGVLNKIIIVPYADGEISIYTNNNILKQKGIIKDGMAFVPLRAVAEAYNMKITWNSEESTANIDDGTRNMNFIEGEDLYVSSASKENMVGMTSPLKLGVAPYIDDEGKMWIPAEALSNMVGYNVKIEGNGHSVSIIKE